MKKEIHDFTIVFRGWLGIENPHPTPCEAEEEAKAKKWFEFWKGDPTVIIHINK
jgi:hypothetical protein